MSPTMDEVEKAVRERVQNDLSFSTDDHHIRVSKEAYAEWIQKVASQMRYMPGLSSKEPPESGAPLKFVTSAGYIRIIVDHGIKPGDWALFKGDEALVPGVGWLNMGPPETADADVIDRHYRGPTFLEDLRNL